MKVAVLSESGADEAAVHILVEGLLGTEIDAPPMRPIRSRGWPAVRQLMAGALRQLHYQTDAEALVVVVDSDFSPVHHPQHDESDAAEKKCRVCQLRAKANEIQRTLRPRQGRAPIKLAVGLAVPAIEAWYLAGHDQHVTETAWILGLQSRKFPYTKNDLKQKVYGTTKPPLPLETERAVEEAERLVQGDNLTLLEQLFPGGFGALARDVRNW